MGKKPFLYIIIIAIASLSCSFFIFFPNIKKIKTGAQEIYKIKENLKEKKGYNTKLGLVKLKAVRIKKETQLNTIFMQKNDPLSFITNLEKLAENNSLEQDIAIEESTNKKDKNDETINKINFSVNVQGDFINIMKYLSLLEKDTYYIQIIDINFNSPDSKLKITDLIMPPEEKILENKIISLNFQAFAYAK